MVFVFDTNTLVSAILKPESIPTKAVSLALRKGHIVFSVETKAELLNVVTRDKFNKYLHKQDRIAKAEDIIGLRKPERNVSKEIVTCQDPNDIKFLLLALAANASCLVSGDKDLTELNPFRNIPILTPRQFLDKYSH
ncbi:MAG: putative toxin-antitoxin system toxin component, PIN family [Bacteroidetes bacterium]|nr:putative toxin-antitoxin system toxin component, PIN family [Bacteroidota bacterium]